MRSPDGRTETEALYHLAEFVEWPPEETVVRGPTFNFCLLGQDPFGSLLDDAVLGHPIGEKPTMVVRGNQFGNMSRCDVLFISSSEAKRLPKILQQVGAKNILTVSDDADFVGDGGIIQFLNNKGHLTFVINVDAAKRAGLRIQAQLLSLAKVVHDNEHTSKD